MHFDLQGNIYSSMVTLALRKNFFNLVHYPFPQFSNGAYCNFLAPLALCACHQIEYVALCLKTCFLPLFLQKSAVRSYYRIPEIAKWLISTSDYTTNNKETYECMKFFT